MAVLVKKATIPDAASPRPGNRPAHRHDTALQKKIHETLTRLRLSPPGDNLNSTAGLLTYGSSRHIRLPNRSQWLPPDGSMAVTFAAYSCGDSC